MEEKRFHKK